MGYSSFSCRLAVASFVGRARAQGHRLVVGADGRADQPARRGARGDAHRPARPAQAWNCGPLRARTVNTIAAAAMWFFLRIRGQKLGLPKGVWASILLLALLNNALPFTPFGWGQTHKSGRQRC